MFPKWELFTKAFSKHDSAYSIDIIFTYTWVFGSRRAAHHCILYWIKLNITNGVLFDANWNVYLYIWKLCVSLLYQKYVICVINGLYFCSRNLVHIRKIYEIFRICLFMWKVEIQVTFVKSQQIYLWLKCLNVCLFVFWLMVPAHIVHSVESILSHFAKKKQCLFVLLKWISIDLLSVQIII